MRSSVNRKVSSKWTRKCLISIQISNLVLKITTNTVCNYINIHHSSVGQVGEHFSFQIELRLDLILIKGGFQVTLQRITPRCNSEVWARVFMPLRSFRPWHVSTSFSHQDDPDWDGQRLSVFLNKDGQVHGYSNAWLDQERKFEFILKPWREDTGNDRA